MITKEIRVGRMISRPIDSFFPRTGVKTYHPMQTVLVCNELGIPFTQACYVPQLENEKVADFEKRISNVMRVLHVGSAVIKGGGFKETLAAIAAEFREVDSETILQRAFTPARREKRAELLAALEKFLKEDVS